ncbi:thioredoxin [Marichromatium purpuratum 984]|uniref:Thioredoxin n=1 Tax=Marichromatium purpuratum 984 TaxID=765910 RepID=W0E580_MARPU|nr:thioredoxin domain-containing protein [Marichromatium purpuratum]AHF04369.1 thioredoxin [Marichromatium purpuratum 984]
MPSVTLPAAGGRNRLDGATSPYLQQHADNPVDWWPWCDEALAQARERDRPILLSIGYSACHWCHVMAHESFADPEVATLMNRAFVNIKVDREERPDLDGLYQRAHQLLNGRGGGWPLTVFLSPHDLRPFFAGTYFPPTPRHGLPAFTQLLAGVERAYREQHDKILQQGENLIEAFAGLEPEPGERPPERNLIGAALNQLAVSFDPRHGGFGGAPKFPHAPELALLLRCAARGDRPGEDAPEPLEMARVSLERMIRSGLNDQLGGGFCRYAVDAQWMIPHFEKMLYDNAALLALCCDLHACTGEQLFRSAAESTADWVLREMQSPEGGYYSSLDADSEGEEGRFYLWEREQVRALLPEAEYRPFAAVYGLDRPPNFEGRWHLHGHLTPAAVAAAQGLTLEQVQSLLGAARATLFAERERRVRPGRDDKVLGAWNALMIGAMARAARVLERDDYLESAEQALGCVRERLWRDGRLLASCRDGRVAFDAYLDDHALLLATVLELLQTRWSSADLAFAIELAETLLARFHDPEAGGFWFTAHDHERLIHRTKPLADETLPAGNGVAALALQRLGHLVGEPRYLAAVESTLRLAATAMRRLPHAHATLLCALDEWLDPPEQLVIRASEELLASWRREAQRGYRADRLVFAIPDEAESLPPLLAAMAPGPRPRVYRCVGTHCEAPREQL